MPPASPEMQALVEAIPGNFADPKATYADVRAMFAPFHGHPVSSELDWNVTTYGGVNCGIYRLPDARSDWTAFHCHGGGFVSTPLDQYHFYGELIARQLNCEVVMPDYRLAPEHPFPAAPNDCYDAWCALCESGLNPARIIVLGESCGGSLALNLLQRLRDEQQPLPACFVSLTGWFDLSVAGPAAPGHDPFLTPQWVRNRGSDYTGNAVALNDPQVSPAYANLSGLPPLYIQIGEYDVMRHGAELLVQQAQSASVIVKHELWPNMVQGWHGLANAGVPEAQAAWEQIVEYVEGLLADNA